MSSTGDPNSKTASGPPRNTLRMIDTELEQLHADFELIEHPSAAKRTHARLPFRHSSLMVEMQQPGGSSKLRYACRNLSSSGVALLHSAYIHNGTTCVVHLAKDDGSSVPVSGSVVRCRFVKGKIHEIGIRFAVPISVHEFVKVDPLLGEFTLENVDAEKLSGAILHVAPAEMDRKLLRHFLEETSLSVVTASSGSGAMERIKESFALIIATPEMGDMNIETFIERLLRAGVSTPVILIADTTSPTLIASARRTGIAAILNKPLAREQVLRAVGEFLLNSSGPSSGAAVVSSVPAGDPRECLLSEAASEINQMGEQLRKMTASTHAAKASDLCSQLCSAARSMGFDVVAEKAEQVRSALPKAADQSWPDREMRELVDLCVRARARNYPASKAA